MDSQDSANVKQEDDLAEWEGLKLDDLRDGLADMLILLSDVAAGDFSRRLQLQFPATHPLGAMSEGINAMVDALTESHERTSAYQRELEEKLATIEQQRVAIRELSTPIIEVWKGVLCLPVVGVMDSARSAEMTSTLLSAVMDRNARKVVIDITGIEAMDTQTADHFVRMARAVKLLGVDCVLTGINPHIAQTMVMMGVDLAGLRTHRSMMDALRHLNVERKREAPAPTNAGGASSSGT